VLFTTRSRKGNNVNNPVGGISHKRAQVYDLGSFNMP